VRFLAPRDGRGALQRLPSLPAASVENGTVSCGSQKSIVLQHGFYQLNRAYAMSTVLLVDDDLDNLWALQLALESDGHHVILAKSGPEALGKLVREPARLIVTDWEMPGMDGGELCRRVRCIPAFAQLPILVLSGAPEPVSDSVCWSTYFRKPVDLASLIFAINTFVAARLTSPIIRLACSEPAPSRWPAVEARAWP
jgi:CheY-like chemotaxis protein